MMDGRVDLHVHSNFSCDGDFSPVELVGFAKARGFRAISIADHDSVAAYPGAVEAGRAAGVEVVPGMEVTTLYENREFHLLMPFVDWTSPAVARTVERMTRTRLDEARERVALLGGLGLDVAWDEVMAAANDAPPLGVKIAQVVLDKPANEANPALARYYAPGIRPFGPYHFYQDFFAEGKPAYVPKRHVPLLEVLDLAPATGAAPVLAHPGAYFQQTTEADLRVLVGRGLMGVEVFTSYHTPAQTAEYGRLAADLDLVPTAGSDFHGRIKPHVIFGELAEGAYWMVERLRERLEARR